MRQHQAQEQPVAGPSHSGAPPAQWDPATYYVPPEGAWGGEQGHWGSQPMPYEYDQGTGTGMGYGHVQEYQPEYGMQGMPGGAMGYEHGQGQ